MRRTVIVGAGVAGLAALDRVVREAGPRDRITLVEPGPPEPGPPPLVGFHPALDRRLGARVQRPASGIWRGVGVGGSGSVNGAVLQRPTGAEALVPGADRDVLEAAVDRWWQAPTVVRPVAGALDHRLAAAGAEAVPFRLALDPSTGRRWLPGLATLDDERVDLVRTTIRCLDHTDGAVIGVVDSAGTRLPADRVLLAAGAAATPRILGASGLLDDAPSGRVHLGRVLDLVDHGPVPPVGAITSAWVVPGGRALLATSPTGPFLVCWAGDTVAAGTTPDAAGLDAVTGHGLGLLEAAGIGVRDPAPPAGGVHHLAATVPPDPRPVPGCTIVDTSVWHDLPVVPPMLLVAAAAEALAGDT